METYYERSLRSKYRSQGVQTSFYESTPSPTNSLGDQISTGSTGNFGHAGTNFPYAPKQRDNGGASRLTRVLLERIPGKKSFRRVASSYRSKESECPHPRTSFPYVHDKLCPKLRRKRRLRVQVRSAGCVLHVPIHPSSRKYLRFTFENRVYQFQVLPFGLNTAPQIFTRLGHTVTAYLHRQGISVIPYLDDWLIHHPDHQVLLRHQALLLDTRPCRLHSESKEIRTGPDSGSPVPRNSLTFGPRESFTPGVQSWGDSCLRTPSVLSRGTKLHSSVPASGVTQLGLRSYPSGSFVPETSSTSFSFVRSDRPVYATASIRPIGPCQPTSAMAGPMFSYLRNPDPPLSGGLCDFHGRLQSGLGRPHGGFQDFRYLDPYRPQAPHQLSGVQSGYFCPTALGSSASGPPSHGRHGQFNSGFIYQQAGRDSLLHPAALNCRPFPLVRVSEHNSLGKTHSRLSERDSRPPISSEPANTDRVVPAPRDRESYLQGLGDTRSRHVCDTVELPPSYDDRWRRFTRWAAGQGFDPLDPTAAQIASFLFDLFDTHGLSPQTIKGYRTCIGSVLNRTGRAKVVLHRTISDMIASMELQ